MPGVPGPIRVPAPGPPATLDPLGEAWPAGEAFWRVFDARWGSLSFHPGDAANPGRFSPFTPARKRSAIPVLYGADTLDGALFETVFHDVPVRGTKQVPREKLRHRLAVQIVCSRALALVDLRGPGLRRLGLTRLQLIESDARSYSGTARWARALLAHPDKFDGLLWVSRQDDRSRALVLFGDRVDESELALVADEVPLTLGAGTGLDAVAAAATRADITITGLT